MASRNVETIRAAHEAFNRRDFDANLKAIAEEIVYRDRARGLIFRGKTEYREYLQGWLKAFSNAEIVQPVYADAGDVVLAQFTGRGVNDGPLGPLPATGKAVKFDLCEIHRFDAGGQVVAVDCYYDQLSLLAQLGHAPAQKDTSAT